MANTILYRFDSIAADRKIATFLDASTYDTVDRGDFSVTVTGRRIYWNTQEGTQLTITTEWNDPTYDTEYSVYLEGTPYNEDGYYKMTTAYNPANVPEGVNAEYNWHYLLTPNLEYQYSNRISEASEECCSVDFNIESIKDLLFLGCFADSVFVIKDRNNPLIGSGPEFRALDGERLIRRAQTIYE